jgi:hypothetical protein
MKENKIYSKLGKVYFFDSLYFNEADLHDALELKKKEFYFYQDDKNGKPIQMGLQTIKTLLEGPNWKEFFKVNYDLTEDKIDEILCALESNTYLYHIYFTLTIDENKIDYDELVERKKEVITQADYIKLKRDIARPHGEVDDADIIIKNMTLLGTYTAMPK